MRLGRWFFGKPLDDGSGEAEDHRPLPQAVPVYLTYLTAIPDGEGVRSCPMCMGGMKQTDARVADPHIFLGIQSAPADFRRLHRRSASVLLANGPT